MYQTVEMRWLHVPAGEYDPLTHGVGIFVESGPQSAWMVLQYRERQRPPKTIVTHEEYAALELTWGEWRAAPIAHKQSQE